MKQKTLDGRAEVVNKGDRVRELAGELGEPSIKELYDACIREGIFSQEDLDRAAYRGLAGQIKGYLKKRDESGLPFAAPTREVDGVKHWPYRQLWLVSDYRSYVDMMSDKESSIREMKKLAIAECFQRHRVKI